MKNHSKWQIFLLLLAIFTLTACSSLTSLTNPKKPTSSPQPIAHELPDLGGREVKIGVENKYLPFNYTLLKTGESRGWDYETWQEICHRLNCKPIFVESPRENILAFLSVSKFDVVADGVTITAERAKAYAFSDAYVNTLIRLVARANEDRFKNDKTFIANESLRVGTVTGTADYAITLRFMSEKRIKRIVAFPDETTMIQALLADKVDAVVFDQIGNQGEESSHVKFVGAPLETQQLGFVYARGSSLVKPVNDALDSMRNDGTMSRLFKKYFTNAFTITYRDIK